MLRIGKNKDQEEIEHTSQKPEAPDYAPKSYPSYQTTSVEAKPAAEPAAPRGAMTESETLARDIKEGTLSGFVGGGTVVHPLRQRRLHLQRLRVLSAAP
jgi:hypothetical protein